MTAICIFEKPPARLERLVGAGAATELAAAFLTDAWSLARSRPWARPVIAPAEPIEHVLRQAGPPAIAMVADIPGVPATLLDEAHAELARGCAVVGPAVDGGCYLIGLPSIPSGVLDGVVWGVPSTSAQVIAKLAARFVVTVLSPWFDVDRGADLVPLATLLSRYPERAAATARVLGTLT